MAILNGILTTLVVLTSLFLICLILIQRGKGGGLAGAFGGVGGSSAFGTKAGDVFTRVTIGVAIVWIILSMLLVILHNRPRQSAFQAVGASSPNEVPVSSEGETSKGKAATTPPGPGPANPPPTTPPVSSESSVPASSSGLPPALPETPPAKTP